MLMASPVNFLCPAGKWPGCFQCQVAEECLECGKCWLAFAKVLEHSLRHGQPPGFLRFRAFGYRNLEPPVENPADTIEFGKRERGVLPGKLEKKLHCIILGCGRSNTCANPGKKGGKMR